MPRRALAAAALLLLVVPAVPAKDAPHPSDPRNFTWAQPGVLAVGGGGLTREQADWLYDQGFRAIADFRAEHRDPEEHMRAKGMEFLDMPVDHAVDLNVSQVTRFVAWAKEQEAAGRPMYIHCTNGWHRAAAMATAWEMERRGLTFDEAAKLVVERRPGTVMRAPAALLAYEAFLTGKPGLEVMLLSPLARPEPGGTMPVTVEVLAEGKPAPGAKVKVWSEESGLRTAGLTDASGRFTFTYKAPPQGTFMDHLYARASHEGSIDGADNVELFYQLPADPGPLEVKAAWTPAGIAVEVLKEGRHVHAHVLAARADGWNADEMASRGRVLLPLPPGEGAVTVRAERWGAEGALVTLAPPAPAEPPRAIPRGVREADAAPALPAETWTWPPQSPQGSPAPPADASPSGAPTRPAWGALALGVLLLGGAWVALRRRAPARSH